MAIYPFLVFSRGCKGPEAYAWEASYETIPLYPGAFSSLILLPLLFVLLIHLVHPEGDFYVEKSDGDPIVRRPLMSGLGGCALPSYGILIGIFLSVLGICG